MKAEMMVWAISNLYNLPKHTKYTKYTKPVKIYVIS